MSEHRTDLELEVLDPVSRVRLQRPPVAEFQRPDRRVPGEADAVRIAEFLVALFQAGAGGAKTGNARDLARIHEHARPNRLVAFENGIEKLGIADDLALPTERISREVAR